MAIANQVATQNEEYGLMPKIYDNIQNCFTSEELDYIINYNI